MTPFAHALLTWFTAQKRQLPWREARTPYRVWVSEVMLQQTQVATATPYFERWLAQFPDLPTLAAAPQETVLKAWEGLGYYRRARLLHEGAKRVVGDYGGVVPERYDALLTLPGVGPYTAAAIASLAFGERVLAVDGNVKRVAARLFRLPGEVTHADAERQLEPHLPETQAGDFNEALMELGATVCTPRTPRCAVCPVSTYCSAWQTGEVTRFPEPKRKKQVPHLQRYALLCSQGGQSRGDQLQDSQLRNDQVQNNQLQNEHVWLRQRTDTEMLGGLWGFVLTEEPPEGTVLEPVTHAYTHFKITATPVVVANETVQSLAGGGVWVPLTAVARLPLSRLDHKLLARWREMTEEIRLFDL